MRIPFRLNQNSPVTKVLAGVAIALVSTLVAFAMGRAPGASVAMSKLDWLFYDSFYTFRSQTDRSKGDVVIVAIDEYSLGIVDNQLHAGWPWPRGYWGRMSEYLNDAGARAIVFDVLFSERAPRLDDDEFADPLSGISTPVVFATLTSPDGKPGTFRIPIESPTFGAANVGDDVMFREYKPTVYGMDSLARAAVRAAGLPLPVDMAAPFLLHYYGPFKRADGRNTYPYVSAAALLAAAAPETKIAPVTTSPVTTAPASTASDDDSGKITPAMFKDKIVIFGGTTQGTFDLKQSPLTKEYPGVEVQATAIDNLIHGDFVRCVPASTALLAAWAASLGAAACGIFPRRVTWKLAGALLCAAILLMLAGRSFTGRQIVWLPMATPLIALILSTLGALAYSYMTEDRARKLVLKALSQYLSPEVAREIAKTGRGLRLGGERREMTVLFTDIAGFTDVSEALTSEQLTTMINFYLENMTEILFDERATVDKFIGDAIMSFWNAPLSQADHAERACRAALRMAARELEIKPQLAELGAAGIHTRLGINTGFMTVGNMGSSQKFNYTVMGDPVNLGSRLEGANKLYGSTIMIAQTTADLVRGKFLMRQLDLLRVKGKLKPMAVFELLAVGEGSADLQDRARAYETAYQQYRQKKWDDAEGTLLHLLTQHPADKPAEALLKRVEKMRHEDLPSDWDGVYVAKDK